MKKFGNIIPARNFLALSLPMILLMVSGCIPLKNPTYLDSWLSAEPMLVGDWAPLMALTLGDIERFADSPECWTIEEADDGYILTATDMFGVTGTFSLHVFDRRDRRYIDMYPIDIPEVDLEEYSMSYYMALWSMHYHYICILDKVTENLIEVRLPNPIEWEDNILSDYEMVWSDECGRSITIDPEILQERIDANLDNEKAWYPIPLLKSDNVDEAYREHMEYIQSLESGS